MRNEFATQPTINETIGTPIVIRWINCCIVCAREIIDSKNEFIIRELCAGVLCRARRPCRNVWRSTWMFCMLISSSVMFAVRAVKYTRKLVNFAVGKRNNSKRQIVIATATTAAHHNNLTWIHCHLTHEIARLRDYIKGSNGDDKINNEINLCDSCPRAQRTNRRNEFACNKYFSIYCLLRSIVMSNWTNKRAVQYATLSLISFSVSS